MGFIEIRDGAFAVPRFGTSYSGLDTRIDLEPDMVRVRRFEILDENGEQLAVAGQLAVHERQVGAVDFTLESENFEIIDNELGDVRVGTNLKVTGELARPKLEGDVRVTAGRLEVDRILQLFYDPYRVEALPEVVSAETAAETAGSAQEATRQALARASQAAAGNRGGAGPGGKGGATVAESLRERGARPARADSGQPRPAGTEAAAGRADARLDWRHEHHASGATSNVRKNTGGPITLSGTVNTVRGTYQFQGRQFDLARNGTLRFTGDADFNPVSTSPPRARSPTPASRRRVRITGTSRQP